MGQAEVAPGLWLDARLALVNPAEGWLIASDIHYGYEVSRRAAGGLFPLWGMSMIEDRFAALLDDHRPRTVILAGDVVDGGFASREALTWLESLRERCERLVLVAGNHDRGEIRRHLEFVDYFETEDGWFIHHGHESPAIPHTVRGEIIGHHHP
ncbi:MAG: metallophosphoesterase, partial [Verrucomicrobiae bacterium]|nr:metallophosphoesterase [Verrucomicrobiae bacterium]